MSRDNRFISQDLFAREEPTLERDEVFDVLSNPRRRLILHYLKQQDDRRRIELREIVDQIAAWENDIPVEDVSGEQRNRVYTALRQSHLPKMDEAGVIEYDNLRGEVELTDGAREAQLYLDYVPREDIPWSYVYLGLTGVSGMLVTLVWADVFPFGGLSGTALAALVTGLFAVVGAAHLYQSTKHRLGGDDAETPRKLS